MGANGVEGCELQTLWCEKRLGEAVVPLYVISGRQ